MYMIVTLGIVYDHVVLFYTNQSNSILPDHHLEIGNVISHAGKHGACGRKTVIRYLI